MSSSERGNKSVRVPADLKRNIESVIWKSRTVLANCPFGHDVRVSVKVEYIPKGSDLRLDVNIHRKKAPAGPKMVQSDEPFTEEYFEALLALPLRGIEKDFVRYFQIMQNEPISAFQWRKEGFSDSTQRRNINRICRLRRIPVSFAPTGEYEEQEGVDDVSLLLEYKFYVMEHERKTRG